MAISVVEFLEVVEIEHEDAERLFGADSAADFAFQHFSQIAAVVEAGKRVFDGLVAQGFAQADVGYGESDLAGEGGLEREFGIVEDRGFFGRLKMQDAEGLALREDRNAEVSGLHAHSVGAGRGSISGNHEVRVAGAQGPAGCYFEDGLWKYAIKP